MTLETKSHLQLPPMLLRDGTSGAEMELLNRYRSFWNDAGRGERSWRANRRRRTVLAGNRSENAEGSACAAGRRRSVDGMCEGDDPG